jgi:hypothetical protein
MALERPMLDFKAQSQFAQATAAMMCSCAMAATTTLAQSATHSLSLWSQMLRTADTGTAGWPWPPRQMAAWMPFAQTWTGPSFTAWTPLAADWTAAWARPVLPGWSDTRRGTAPQLRLVSPAKAATEAKAPDPGYASYRSAGGHATAQVIIAATPQAALEELASTMVFSPMQTMLDLWRSALKV